MAVKAITHRKFIDAKGSSKKTGTVDQAIAMIARLYRIQTELASTAADDTYMTTRREKAEPVLTEFRAWLDEKALRVPPSSALGKAVTYALGWGSPDAYYKCACKEEE